MKIIPLLMILFVNLSVHSALAQNKILAGKVKDEHSEEGVAFASVQFKNTTIGRFTDSSGSFSFSLTKWPADTLEITCVGYQPYFLVINKDHDSTFVSIMLQRGKFNEG
ncbi:MAG TPA: carboxypeptidase-like regulatory domain-containing protein, partial [Chitinophagaceae bacterium]|nr:carboxypeptidase-like regulatory domain-containing protein [Chitinophagaceae bacterium]